MKPGEYVEESSGRVQVSGQTAVMSMNALMVKIIFDKNPGHEFYIEESFPLDWMFPYLEPLGLILKINRQPLAELPDNMIGQDRAYWDERVSRMIGDWLTQETSVQAVAEFVEKTYLRRTLTGSKAIRNLCRTITRPGASRIGGRASPGSMRGGRSTVPETPNGRAWRARPTLLSARPGHCVPRHRTW